MSNKNIEQIIEPTRRRIRKPSRAAFLTYNEKNEQMTAGQKNGTEPLDYAFLNKHQQKEEEGEESEDESYSEPESEAESDSSTFANEA